MGVSNINKLLKACESSKITFKSITIDLSGNFIVLGHNPELCAKKPVLSEMRDFEDYSWAMNSWLRKGAVILGSDKNFSKAIKYAIEYLQD